MPSNTRKSKVAQRVMPESDAIARLQANLAEYDAKFRRQSDEIENMAHVAEHLSRAMDEAINLAQFAQALVKNLSAGDTQEAGKKAAHIAKIESWFRAEQGEIRRLMS